MPPKDGKKRLVILDNLDLFVEKLLTRVAEESEQARADLIEICETAKRKYNQPIQSWFFGFIYQYSRVRGSEVDLAIKSMEEFHDTCTRLQEIKLLVSKGKWNVGSYNYYLFDGLISSIPGYEPLTDKNREAVIERVSELIIDKIDSFIAQYIANRKLIEAKEKELKNTQQSIQQTVDNVLIAKTLELASSSAQSSHDKIQFVLYKEKNIWKLHWVDVLGKAYSIEPGDELIEILHNKQSEDLDTLHPLIMKRLKRECVKARDMFLDRVQILVNPKNPRTNTEMSNDELEQTGNLTTFVLRGEPGHYSLCWINSLGKDKAITLDEYPQMATWLEGQKSLTEEHIYTLRSYLMYVNTSKSIGMDEFKTQLKNCLEKRPPPPPPKDVDQPNTGKKLDLRLFADLEKCLQRKKDAPPVLAEPSKDEETTALSPGKVPLPGKLNLKLFSTVVNSIEHKQNAAPEESVTGACSSQATIQNH